MVVVLINNADAHYNKAVDIVVDTSPIGNNFGQPGNLKERLNVKALHLSTAVL